MHASLHDKLAHVFHQNFEEGLEVGASLAVYHHGRKMVSLYGGWRDAAKTKTWEADTLALIWSASKGVAAACLLHLLQEKNISLEEKVATFWPEFATAGKEKSTLAHLLSHQAGLAALEQKGLSLHDHAGVAHALATQAPNWSFDGTHGYGARTFGFLLDELVRRLSGGISLANYWQEIFAKPLGLDLSFGLAPADFSRVADVIAPKKNPPLSKFTMAYMNPFSLTRRTFAEPEGHYGPSAMNKKEAREAGIISFGAFATAEALAHFYSLLALTENNPFFSPETQAWMQTPLTHGLDRVLLAETTFSAGFMMDQTHAIFGNHHHIFGHPGAGGALAFADTKTGLGFAYIPNAMQPEALPGPRTRRLVEALYQAIGI